MPLPGFRRLIRRPPPGSGDFSRHLSRYVGGNRLTVLRKGREVYEAMWAAIEGAAETIHLESYILRSDRTGEEFARRLADKARGGVRVRVIFDAVGSMGIAPGFVHKLRNAGVQFLEYHPIAPWRPRWSWWRRDHRKCLIVDSKTAFTGGVNICDDHAPLDRGGQDWRDVHVKLEGPAAYELDRVFRAVWFKETGRWFALDARQKPAVGTSRVWVAANQEFIYRYLIRSAYLGAIKAAQREVIIANAYFCPDWRTSRALAAAARRGVSVKILLPGVSDVPAVWWAGRYQFEYLLERGVKIYFWPGPVLHAKTAVIDESWATVGSYNMDHRSLLTNLEVNFNILDAGFAKELCALLAQDIADSREIKLEQWRRRPYREKLVERFFYLFSYFY